jgi:hypothetical protein
MNEGRKGWRGSEGGRKRERGGKTRDKDRLKDDTVHICKSLSQNILIKQASLQQISFDSFPFLLISGNYRRPV